MSELDENKYFLVEQRRAVTGISDSFNASRLDVRYTAIKKNKASAKRKIQTSNTEDANHYCVLDAKDRLVKPKKLTRKGKILHIEVEDNYSFDLLNFFERDVKRDISPKFVSHIDKNSGGFDVIDGASGDVVELHPDDAMLGWCSRQDMPTAPELDNTYSQYAVEDLRASLNPVIPDTSATSVISQTGAVDPIATSTVVTETGSSDMFAGLLPYLLPLGLAAIGGGGGGGGGGAEQVIPNLTVQGRIMLGPVVDGNDLYVIIYDAKGNVLGVDETISTTKDAFGAYIDYQIVISKGSTYAGVVTVCLRNKGENSDYISEYLVDYSTDPDKADAQIDIGTTALYAMDLVSSGSTIQTINITQATDLVARHFIDEPASGTPKLGSTYTPAHVDAANKKIASLLLGSDQSITTLAPESTIDVNGDPSGTTSEYALLLHSLDIYLHQYITAERNAVIIAQDVYDNAQTAHTTATEAYTKAKEASDLAAKDAADKAAAAKKAVGTSNEAVAKAEAEAAAAIATAKAADAEVAAATLAAKQTALSDAQQVLSEKQKALADKSSEAQEKLVSWADDVTPTLINILSLDSYLPGQSDAPYKHPGAPDGPDKTVVNIYQGVSTIGDDSQYTAKIPGNVFNVSVTDTSAVTYHITGGADQDLFAIDNVTGLVTWKSSPPISNKAGDKPYEVIVTASKVGGLAAVSQLLRVHVDITPPDNPDLSATVATQLADSAYINAAEASAGKSIAANIQAPASQDIGSITITLGGTLTGDALVLDGALSHALDTNFSSSSSVNLGGVAGLKYDYDSANHVLILKRFAGGAFAATDIDNIISAIKLQTTGADGVRTATISYTDLAGNSSASSAVSTLQVDKTAPAALDLRDDISPTIEDADHQYLNATVATAGKSIAAKLAEITDTDIGTIKVLIGGSALDTTKDQLVLDVVHGLNAKFTGSNATIGGIAGVDYSYDPTSKILSLTPHLAQTPFGAADLNDIVKALLFKTTSVIQGDRTATISCIDLAGNTTAAAVTSTLTIDTISPNATLAVSEVETDGATVCLPGWSDRFLVGSESYVVLKVDSTTLGSSALKVGDVITLQIKDIAASTAAGHDVFVDLTHKTADAGAGYAIGDKYTYTVTADDIASGDGVDKAAYIQVDKGDLTSGLTNVLNTIRANIVDLAGNAFDTAELGITVQAPITLTLDKDAIDLDVTSQIVLTSSQTLATAVAGKKITFTNLGGNGFAGESATNTFSVDADDTRYVTIKGDKIIIKTPWDFDFANDYQITVDVGAFKTKADPDTDAPELETKAVLAADAMNFNTVAVGSDFLNAAQGNVILDDGTVDTGKKWFSVEGSTSTQSYDLGGGGYAMVFKDNAAGGQNPTINDGVETDKTIKVVASNFDADDLIYADDQNNSAANLNSKNSTQVIDYGSATQKTLHFDPSVTTGGASDGATFTLNSASNLSTQDVLDRLNISNSRSEPTPITALTRLDASTNLIGASTTDINPLRVKVTAAVAVGDHIQLVYIDANGAVQNIGSEYTALASDKVNGYVTLSLSKTLLLSLPQQEGYNQIFAKLTNTTGGITYSSLLGGDSGVYLDAVSPVPTLTAKSGQDSYISTGETEVDLVVSASHLSVGDVLVLKLGATQLGTWTVTAANFGTDAAFKVPSAKLVSGPNTLTVTSTDAAGNVGTSSLIVTREEYIDYSGRIGFGPILADNDLVVTAYDNAGNAIAQSTAVSSSGTYTLQISTSYKGAITLRVSSAGTKTDYWDESTAKAVDMGDGSIAAVAFADGKSKTINISKLTDLVARQLSFGNAITASEAQINAYNLQLAKLLIDTATTTDITGIAPSFVVNSSGTSTATAANKYGQLLAQISSQAKVLASSMDAIQAELSNAISWNWASPTATLALNGTLAKQVVLLCKVAQAAALETGTSASQYLTAVDFANYGFTGISALSSARQTDFISRIVSTANTGAELDTLAELQALADKETALAKIQDYATSNANPIPTLADYTAAGITNVSAANLFAVNSKMNGSAAAGTVPVDSVIQAVVNLGVSTHSTAIAKIVAYADDSVANTAPSVSTYELAGVTGATADNLAAINVKIDAVNAGILSTGAATIVADIQVKVSAAIVDYNNAFTALRAYILDGLANTVPDVDTYTDLGLTAISSTDQISSANYYLNSVMADTDASLSDSSILSKLTLQQTALNKINAYAVSSANAAPSVNDYIAAGIVKATDTNSTLLNALVDAQTSIATASSLATLLAPVFEGVPFLQSIVRAGSSVSSATYQNDSYLNATEIASGQTAKFTITFDRSVTGLTASNFGLTDVSGNAIAGATPALTLTSADAGAGKVWNVVVSNLSNITSSSVRLNLINNTGVTDTIGGLALSNTSYREGQSYAVDQTNTFVVSALLGGDFNLDSTEASANIHIAPDTLSIGDVLSLTKADGTVIGTSVTVTQSHLGTGVTFNVPKTGLSTGANQLTVHSTDIAGNQGASTVTVTVQEYVTFSGVVGLPSKLLSNSDLIVSAYDSTGTFIGSGSINATTGTYSLDLLKSQTGHVILKITNQDNGKDYWDTSLAAQADLGSTTISSSTVANGTNQTVNITLLTDIASSLIRNIGSPSSAQISAVNLALTKLLLNSSSNTSITEYNPDFTTDALGVSTISTATMYGQIMDQLAQQAKEKFSSLAVVLTQMANGMTFDGTTITLNSAFAKEVFLLAKTQMAASLDTGASASAYLSAQDLIDYGVVGVNNLTAARKADLIARIVATTNDGNQVDTLTELQAITNSVVALGKIQDYADSGTTPLILSDYSDAALVGVTSDNLAAVNARIYNSDATSTGSFALIQSIVDTGLVAYSAVLLKIANYANDHTSPEPTLADYLDAGVTGVNATNLVAVNAKVSAGDAASSDTTAEIQTLANAGAVECANAISVIKAYMLASSTAAVPDLATYQKANLASINTAAQVDNANYLISHILSGQSLTDTQLASKLSDQITAINSINTYATTGGTVPTVTTYANAGFTQVVSTDLNDINARINSATSIETTAAILSVLRAIDLDRTKLDIQATSSITLNASTSLSEVAIFSGVSKTYLDTDIVSIKIAAAGPALDGMGDKFVFENTTKAIDTQALTGSNVTINTVTGINWSYNIAKQLIFTKSDGSTFTAAQAQLIEQAVKFQSSSIAAQGLRTFTLSHASVDGSISATATNTVTVDTTVPAPDTYNTALGAAGQFLLPNVTLADTGASYARIVAQFNTSASDYGVATTYAANLDILTLSDSVKGLANTTWNAATGTLTITAASSEWTLSQVQKVLQAIQYANLDPSVANPTLERHINITVSDAAAANAVSILKAVTLTPSADFHSAQLDTVASQIALNFDAPLTGTPQLGDFSDIKLDGVAASLSAVNLSGSSLLLSLASAVTSDAVLSLNYTPNASSANRIQSAGASLEAFALLQDKTANSNTALIGTAGKHNIIIGNGGADTMTGAELSDTFVFGLDTTGTSHVTNFSISQGDKLDLTKLISSYTSTYGTNSLSKYISLSTVNSGHDLQLQIDKDGLGNFTTGLDATVILTDVGTTATNAGIANNSAQLTDYLLKHSAVVL